jgi:iron complex outermembrane receptor protein
MGKCRWRRWVSWSIVVLVFLPLGVEAAEESVRLGDVTVTATKTEVELETVPFAVHSVDRETLDRQPRFFMNNVGEVIRDLPGVHVAQYYPWGPPWIHLRGTGYFIGRTVYLVDGLPTWSFMSTTLNPKDIERADVLLGPSSALYGANASGGAVNFVTRRGEEGMGATAELAYGSNNTFRPHASVGDRPGDWGYYLSYSGDYSDGYAMKPVDGMVELWNLGKKQYLREASLEDNEYESNYLSGKLDWENDAGAKAWIGVQYAQRYLYGGQENMILNDDGDQAITTARLEFPFGNIGKVKFTGAYQYYDHPQQYTNGLSLRDGNLVLDPSIMRNRDWTVNRIPLELQSDFYLGRDNILTAGVFWSREEEQREDRFAATGTVSRYEVTTDQTAFYLQDQMFFLNDRLSLLAGLRYDQWEYRDIFVSAAEPQRPDEVSKDTWTVRGGVKYRLTDAVGLRTSAGTAYWPGLPLWFFQSISSGSTWREANPDLEPEKTWMVDAGADVQIDRTGTVLSLTGYYGEIEDMVSYRYDENPFVEGGTIIRTQNLGGAEIYGLELGFRQPLSEHWWIDGSVTLNRSEIVDDPQNGGNQLRNAPDYWGSLGLNYANPELFNANLLFRFSDDRFYDDENTELPYFHMEAYETLDCKIWRDWSIAPGWILTTSFSAVNIFDDDYATEIVYVNPGRYLEGTIGVRYVF